MLKRIFEIKKISFIVILAMILSMFIVSNVFAKTTTLILTDSDPAVGILGVYLNALKDEIETRTEGQVKLEIYSGESLLTSKEILKGVKDGVADIGRVNPNNFPQELFVNSIFSIFPQGPIQFENIYEVITSAYEEIPNFNEEMEAQNQKIMGIRIALPTAICSTKPFTSFEDFKGKKIRAASRWWLGFLEGAGAIPISMPMGDLYIALETGNIDGVYTNLDGIMRWKNDEAAPNMFLTQELWTPIPMIYTMNLKKWNSFPDDIKKDIEDSFEAVVGIFGEAYENEWEKSVAKLKEDGRVVTKATPEDIQKWVSMPVVGELQAQWISEAKGFGIDNAEEIVNKIKALIQEGLTKEKQGK